VRALNGKKLSPKVVMQDSELFEEAAKIRKEIASKKAASEHV